MWAFCRLVNVAATATRPWVLDRDILLLRQHDLEQRCSARAAWPRKEDLPTVHDSAVGSHSDEDGQRYHSQGWVDAQLELEDKYLHESMVLIWADNAYQKPRKYPCM